MTHLERSRDLMRRARAIASKNPEFAQKLFKRAQQEYLLYLTVD